MSMLICVFAGCLCGRAPAHKPYIELQCLFDVLDFSELLTLPSLSLYMSHDKTCLREFPTRPDINRPALPQKLARVLKFRL